MGSGDGWWPVRDSLRRAGIEPKPLDLPGHGVRSGEVDPSRFTLEATLSLMDAEFPGPGSVPLVGYSMGGRVALHYALRRPGRISHLVLESASPGLADPDERAARVAADEERARALESDGIETFVDRWESLPLFRTQASLPRGVRSELRSRRLSNDPASLAASLRGIGTGAVPSLWGELHDLSSRVLLIAGARDGKFVEIAERMADRISTAEIRIVSDAGHRVHLERPDEWVAAVAGFLSS